MGVALVAIFLVGIANCQRIGYGPPNYSPGQPIGGSEQEIIKATGYEAAPVSTNYGVPTQSVSQTLSNAYGSPASSAYPLYGPPGGSRFRVIPANEFKIPEQHSNLIRYIVLKEFQIGSNGSVTPHQMGMGRNTPGSPEIEVMKMQLPNSGEASGVGGYANGPVTGGYADAPKEGDDEEGDDYDDEDGTDDDYDDDEEGEVGGEKEMKNNSVEDSVVLAKGVDLNTNSKTSAFMFSDPNSNSLEAQSRQGTAGLRDALRDAQLRRNKNRNQTPGRRNRNRNRQRNRQRNRNRKNKNKMAMTTAAGEAATATAGTMPPIDDLQNALSVLSRYFNAQAGMMRASMGGAPSSSFTAPDASSASSGYASSAVSSSSSSSGYSGSGQPESRPPQPPASAPVSIADATVIDSDKPLAMGVPTQATPLVPQESYGVPGGNSLPAIPSITDTITRPIQQAANFKAAVLNQVANGLTAGIRGVGTAATALSNSLGGGSDGGSTSYGVPGSGSLSPVRQILGLKGQAVRTVANTGKAAVGIVGTKGQFVANQVGTVAQTITKGFSQTVNNKHDAIQNVIKHIQGIFAANPNMAYGTW